MSDIRQYIRDMAEGLTVLHSDGTPDPVTSAEMTGRLLSLAALDDEALSAALG